jgi:hypothetical protein
MDHNVRCKREGVCQLEMREEMRASQKLNLSGFCHETMIGETSIQEHTGAWKFLFTMSKHLDGAANNVIHSQP